MLKCQGKPLKSSCLVMLIQLSLQLGDVNKGWVGKARRVHLCNFFLHYNYDHFFCRVYKGASKDHVITNVAGGKTLCLKKMGFPDTGTEDLTVI